MNYFDYSKPQAFGLGYEAPAQQIPYGGSQLPATQMPSMNNYPRNMQQPYGGESLPGTQPPSMGGYKHPSNGLPTPLQPKKDFSQMGMTAGLGAQAQDPSQGIGMSQLKSMANRTGQQPYEDFISSRGYQDLPYGLLGG